MTRPLLLLALVAAGAASAQPADPSSPVVRLGVGLDGHRLGDLAAWQRTEQAALADDGIALQETDAFPSFPSVRLEAGYAGGRWNYQRDIRYEVGVEVGLGSTGGRLYYQDYSGTFIADRLVRRLVLGVYGEHEVALVGPVLVAARLHLRASPTATTYRRDVVVGDEAVEAAEATFRTVPVSVLPALVAEADVSRRFRVRAHAGYEWSTAPDLPSAGRADALPDEARWGPTSPGVGWSGARVGVGLAARLGGQR